MFGNVKFTARNLARVRELDFGSSADNRYIKHLQTPCNAFASVISDSNMYARVDMTSSCVIHYVLSCGVLAKISVSRAS